MCRRRAPNDASPALVMFTRLSPVCPQVWVILLETGEVNIGVQHR